MWGKLRIDFFKIKCILNYIKCYIKNSSQKYKKYILNVLIEKTQTGLLGSLLTAKLGSIEAVKSPNAIPIPAPKTLVIIALTAQFSIKVIIARSSGPIGGRAKALRIK